MTSPALPRAATAGVVLAIVVLALNAWLSYENIRRLADNDWWVSHTEQVLTVLGDVLVSATEAEAAQRGYLLTGEEVYLGPYQAAAERVGQQIARAKELTQDNLRQQERVGALQTQIKEELRLLGDHLSSHRAGGAIRPDLVLQGKKTLDAIRATVADARAEEERLLAIRLEASSASYWVAVVTLTVATGLAALVVTAAYALLLRNLNARQRAAEIQERLAAANRQLLESTGEGIYGLDLEGRCTFLNRAAARMLHRTPADVLGQSMHPLTHHTRPDGSPYPAEECPIYRVSRNGQGGKVDNEYFWRADGTCFPVEYTAYPIIEAGQLRGSVVSFTDITLRKQAEDDLREAKAAAETANVAKSRFLANMSHELRTPLNAVILYSELLQEEAEDRGVAEFIPDLDKIRTAGKHLLSLVNSVLDLSKIEAGKMELHLESFEVEKMVEEVAGTVQALVQKRSNTLEADCAPEVGVMHADLTKVRQVLFNLLSNASKFTENGSVRLQVGREREGEHDWIVFRVMDTGIGMTAAQMAGLFRPFAQADASTTRKYGGTGLGLTISKRFCELMGGDLTVASESGQGSVFTARLPARVAAPPGQETSGGATATETPALSPSSPVVLVIDDEPAVRETLVRFLTAEGLQPVTAANGEEGLRLAASVRPAVIILDVMMPRMDGWSVLSALKADPRLADIPVVLLTLVNEKDLGYLLGAAEYLTKPVDWDRLAVVLRKYCPAGGAPRVLVVEDDEATREVLLRMLTKHGWSVAEAENGRAALRRMEEQVPALILLDLMMPEIDGFEFLAVLRRHEEWRAVPVVVLTSKDLSPEERTQLTGNVERILQKGEYNREALLREVRQVVALCTGRAAGSDKPDLLVTAAGSPMADGG
jgi:PAS domain S-box-containing protein